MDSEEFKHVEPDEFTWREILGWILLFVLVSASGFWLDSCVYDAITKDVLKV